MFPQHKRLIRLNVLEERYIYFLEKGVLFLEEDIDESTASIFPLDLMYVHSCLDREKPIWVILRSPGGLVHYGLGIYDTIKMIRVQGRVVNILGMGLVASMATVILQAGTNRYSSANTQFLLHQVSETIIYKSEEASEQEDRAEETKRLNNVVMDVIAARSGIPIEELKKRCKKTDYWLDPIRARELGSHGLVDEIIENLPFLDV